MADEKKQAPDWVDELGTLIKEFIESHEGVAVSIIANDDKGYWAHIPDYNLWNGQLQATLIHEPTLFMPTADAVSEAYEYMQKTVDENKIKGQGIPLVINVNRIKS